MTSCGRPLLISCAGCFDSDHPVTSEWKRSCNLELVHTLDLKGKQKKTSHSNRQIVKTCATARRETCLLGPFVCISNLHGIRSRPAPLHPGTKEQRATQLVEFQLFL